jgi:rhodanese-related sulfurtransferase
MKYKTLSITDSEKLIKELKPMILDCRDLKDYRAGHLEDALHVHEGLKDSLVKRGDKQRSLLIYCYYGHASEHLAEFFSDFGFKDVYSLEGGYSTWKDKQQEKNYFSVAEPVLMNSAGIYPLILASQQGRSDVVNFLIEQNAVLDVVDHYGNNALWAACYAESIDCIEALIISGIKVNHQNSASGATALIFAASSGRETVVERLLAAGADPTLKTHDDFTALDLASTRKILNLLSKLVKSGD